MAYVCHCARGFSVSAHHVGLLGPVHSVGVLSQGVVAQVLHLLHKICQCPLCIGVISKSTVHNSPGTVLLFEATIFQINDLYF